jgi:tRNA A37 threonylcarbamoyladenosine synthetase subunit TsaC/SUA5/YrdC
MDTEQSEAARVYDVLRSGGVVLLPTDVGYGLIGCSDDAIARIYELKGRPRSKACVTVANMSILDEVARLPDDDVRGWLETISAENPIAVINSVREDSVLLQRLSPFLLAQATSNDTIATFLNAGKLVTRVAELALVDRRLVFGSSANVASRGNNYALCEVPASIRDHVDLVIDHGPARYRNTERLATTMLDPHRSAFLRKGINYAIIAEAWDALREQRSGAA